MRDTIILITSGFVGIIWGWVAYLALFQKHKMAIFAVCLMIGLQQAERAMNSDFHRGFADGLSGHVDDRPLR